MLEDLILEKFAPLGVRRGGELYLPLSTGKVFEDECNSINVAVIGLEIFHIKPGMTIPQLSIFDSGSILHQYEKWDDVVEEINELAFRYLQMEEERDPTQYYNPFLFEESEWR